ncbi:unnamed protein product [Heligmosomoides polygyrus]|uniref:DDE_Tnp_1_7 domain-containing protein n=1 Tax=Heligmosomoides polygyrus TaxID=6339 RepID=A0A183G1G7_HELPZ|nr:unnamed protein product [Heligmosomoides polygyrus]
MALSADRKVSMCGLLGDEKLTTDSLNRYTPGPEEELSGSKLRPRQYDSVLKSLSEVVQVGRSVFIKEALLDEWPKYLPCLPPFGHPLWQIDHKRDIGIGRRSGAILTALKTLQSGDAAPQSVDSNSHVSKKTV